MRTLSWVLLLLAGIAALLVSFASAGLAYTHQDYAIGGIAVAEVAASRPGLELALRGVRGTSAAYGAAFAVFYLFVVLGPYRRGERWAWWAILVTVATLVLIALLRVPTLGVKFGIGAPLIQGTWALVGLLLDVGRLKRS